MLDRAIRFPGQMKDTLSAFVEESKALADYHKKFPYLFPNGALKRTLDIFSEPGETSESITLQPGLGEAADWLSSGLVNFRFEDSILIANVNLRNSKALNFIAENIDRSEVYAWIFKANKRSRVHCLETTVAGDDQKFIKARFPCERQDVEIKGIAFFTPNSFGEIKKYSQIDLMVV